MSRGSADDGVGREGVDEGRLAMSERTAGIVLAQLQRRSRTLRFSPEDREDLVQDVAIWIARHRETGRPITQAWLWSVLVRFARSFRRAHRRETPLEDFRAEAEPTRAPRRPSASVEELTRGLGETERKVVELLLEGHRWESALKQLGICHGNHSRWRKRIRRRFDEVMGRCRPG